MSLCQRIYKYASRRNVLRELVVCAIVTLRVHVCAFEYMHEYGCKIEHVDVRRHRQTFYIHG